MRRFLTALSFCTAAPLAGHAAEAPAGRTPAPAVPADDLDALSLADKAPVAVVEVPRRWRVFVEGAAGRAALRGGPGFDTGRASLDLRFDDRLTPSLRAVLSNRLDLLHHNGADDVNTLREAYLSWAAGTERTFDIGRVNIRHGAAWGYNPTDFFKEGALRWAASPDPAQLRENRQGTFVLQGQQLWRNGALTAAFSPKLASTPAASTFTLDAGSTNNRHRWLLAGSLKLGERLNPELLVYGGVDTPAQLGVNLSTLLGDATVVFGEFTAGRGRSLVAQALNTTRSEHDQRRAAVGLTYTTAFNLSLTAEAEYNSAAPDAQQWRSLSRLGPAAPLQVLGSAQAQQELPVRSAVFAYATWKDALWRRFDLSAFMRHEEQTSSRAQWLEARYRWDRVDLSLQMQWFSGAAGSVFGIVPQRRAVELALRGYL